MCIRDSQHPDLAQLLESELLAAANYLPVVAADLFVQSLRLVIVTYSDIEQLKAQLIADYPVEIGRAFYALSPIIFEAFVTLDSLILLLPSSYHCVPHYK